MTDSRRLSIRFYESDYDVEQIPHSELLKGIIPILRKSKLITKEIRAVNFTSHLAYRHFGDGTDRDNYFFFTYCDEYHSATLGLTHPARALFHAGGCGAMSYPSIIGLDGCLGVSDTSDIRVYIEPEGKVPCFYGDRACYLPLDIFHGGVGSDTQREFIIWFLSRYLNPPSRLPSLEDLIKGRRSRRPITTGKTKDNILLELVKKGAERAIITAEANVKEQMRAAEAYRKDANTMRFREREYIQKARDYEKEVERIKSQPQLGISKIRKLISALPEISDFKVVEKEITPPFNGDAYWEVAKERDRAGVIPKMGYFFKIMTKPLQVSWDDEGEGETEDVGRFLISFSYDQDRGGLSGLKIKNKTYKMGCYDHPHIKFGVPCWGGYGVTFSKAWHNGDIFSVVLECIAGLKSYNFQSPLVHIETWVRRRDQAARYDES